MPLADYIGGFYIEPPLDYRTSFRPGQLYWAPAFFLPPHPDVLYEVSCDPSEAKLVFRIQPMTAKSFRGAHRPLATIQLPSTEELIAIRAKKRIVVLLSQENFVAEPTTSQAARSTKLHEQSYACLPLYGVHRAATEPGFPLEVVARIQALMYNQFFYLPQYPSTAEEPMVYEAIGRLDRIQVFHRDTLAFDPLRLALHPDLLFVLQEWMRNYLTGQIDGAISEMRRELIGELYGARS